MRTIYPVDVVLFEGILVLYDPEIRDMMQMKLFVDTDSDTRLARRGQFLHCILGNNLIINFLLLLVFCYIQL